MYSKGGCCCWNQTSPILLSTIIDLLLPKIGGRVFILVGMFSASLVKKKKKDHCSMLERRKHKAVPSVGHDDVRKWPESCRA